MHNTSQKSPNVEKGFTSKSEQWCRVGGVGGGLTLNFQMKIRVHTVYCQTWISKISPPTTSMIIGKRFITLYLPVFLFNPIRPIACYMLIDINDNIISYQFFFFLYRHQIIYATMKISQKVTLSSLRLLFYVPRPPSYNLREILPRTCIKYLPFNPY